MVIVRLQIDLETSGPKDADLAPKSIVLNGNTWKLPQDMFPRDIRFVAELERLIQKYNKGHV